VPELQGEPEDISKEKARMAASQVLQSFLLLAYRDMHPINSFGVWLICIRFII
jgi:hypothetical protein